MGLIYSKHVESTNLKIFESVIFLQDANPSLISHNSTIIIFCFLLTFQLNFTNLVAIVYVPISM